MFATDRSTGQPVELQITADAAGSITFRRKGAGRLITLSKAEFDKRFDHSGTFTRRQQPPAAPPARAAAPSSPRPAAAGAGGPPRPFDPTAGAPPATSSNELRALHGKLDDIFDEVRDVAGKVSAIFRVIAEGPKPVDETPAHDPEAGAPERTTTDEPG